jgi:dGTPase
MWEVRDGILGHTGPHDPVTMEGRIVRICDRVAYINHDIDDALRAGLIAPADLPGNAVAGLGSSGSERIDLLVHDLVDTSDLVGDVAQSPLVGEAMEELRAFLFRTVYARSLEDGGAAKIRALLTSLFEYFLEHPQELPGRKVETPDTVLAVTDYIAGMTDRFAQRTYFNVFMPRSWA